MERARNGCAAARRAAANYGRRSEHADRRGHDPLAVRASAGRWLLCVQLFWHWRWNALHALIHRLPLCNCLHQLAVMMAHSFMLEKAAGAGWVSAWTLKTLIARSAMLRHQFSP